MSLIEFHINTCPKISTVILISKILSTLCAMVQLGFYLLFGMSLITEAKGREKNV